MAHMHDIYDLYLKVEANRNSCASCREFQDFIGTIIDLSDYFEKNAVRAGRLKERFQ